MSKAYDPSEHQYPKTLYRFNEGVMQSVEARSDAEEAEHVGAGYGPLNHKRVGGKWVPMSAADYVKPSNAMSDDDIKAAIEKLQKELAGRQAPEPDKAVKKGK